MNRLTNLLLTINYNYPAECRSCGLKTLEEYSDNSEDCQLEGGDTTLTTENQDPDASQQEKKVRPKNDSTLLPAK